MATILAVDDDPGIVSFLGEAIRNLGHVLVSAGDGEEALRIAREHNPGLVLLDVELPGMSGYDLCIRLKAIPSLAAVPMVFMSVRGAAEDRLRGLELGAIDYLAKPFSIAELMAKVRTLLAIKGAQESLAQESLELCEQMERQEVIISSFFPKQVILEIQRSDPPPPRWHENVAVLIADIVGFTPFCESHDPGTVLANLRELGCKFEGIAKCHGLEKVNFIGDSFVAAAGLFEQVTNPVLSALHCGFDLSEAAATVPAKWQVRVGIDFGQVVSGVPGTERTLFGIFGDTVNTAARMQTLALPDRVSLSGAAWEWVAGLCKGYSLGLVEVKGKGLMEVFHAERPAAAAGPPPADGVPSPINTGAGVDHAHE